MKTKEQVLTEIQNAMTLNKNNVAKCNSALSDAKSLIMHEEKELHNCLEKEYKRGMNDALEIVEKCYKISYDESMYIFGTDSVAQIIKKYTLLEIKDKLSSYNTKENEENKIHVSDVIQNKNCDTKGTILGHDNDDYLVGGEGYWMVFTEEGCVESWCENDFIKTGESVDVFSALIK